MLAAGRFPARFPDDELARGGVAVGTLSGFSSFISHAGRPPYQIYMVSQRLDKLVFAGTTTILFAAINVMKVIP